MCGHRISSNHNTLCYKKVLSSSDPNQLTFSLTDIRTLYLAFFLALSNILSGIYSDIPSCILSYILSDMLSGILSDICSDILSGILIWHLFWYSFWHLFKHSLWHVFGSRRAPPHPELTIWLGSVDAHSQDELQEEHTRSKGEEVGLSRSRTE